MGWSPVERTILLTFNPEQMAQEAVADRPLEMPDLERLSKLAKDIVQGVVFSSDAVQKADADLLPSIFMPLALGATKGMSDAEIGAIGLFYAPMDSAFGRAINGYPCFGSVGWLCKRDATIVREKWRKMMDLLEQV